MRTTRLTALIAASTAAAAALVATAGPGFGLTGTTTRTPLVSAKAACAYPSTTPVVTVSAPVNATKGSTITIQGTVTNSTCPVEQADVAVYVQPGTGARVLLATVKSDSTGTYRTTYTLANAAGRTYTFQAMSSGAVSGTAATLAVV